MIIRTPHRRRAAARLSTAAAVMSGFMLTVSVWTVATGPSSPVAAATAGSATITDASGTVIAGDVTNTSLTQFKLKLPSDAACSGDSANSNFRIQSYMVPIATDPGSLSYKNTGPVGAGPDPFIQPVFFDTGNPYVQQLTALQESPGGPGPIPVPIDPFSLKVFTDVSGPIPIPPGQYNIGIACSNPAPTQTTDKYWNAVMTVATDPNDANAVTWTVSAGGGTTTTTVDGTTTTTVDGTTTTTVDGTTTTTVDGTTSTTGGGSTSTTDADGGGATTATSGFTGGNPASPSVASTVGQLPYTGSSPWSLVIWGALLLVFGRMAMLLGRKPRVKTPTG